MPFNLDTSAVEIYQQSRLCFLAGDEDQAFYWYWKNRRENSCDIFWEIDIPKLRLIHPMGCVLGRATYKGHFVAYNGSSVGSTLDREYPVIGDGVVLFPGARIIGKAVVGDNCLITANTVVQDCEIPSNSVVFPVPFTGASNGPDGFKYVRNISAGWKPTKRSVVEAFFK